MNSTDRNMPRIGRVECADEIGTAFLVAPGTAVTARHVVVEALISNAPINIDFGNGPLRFVLHSVRPPIDCDLILLTSEVADADPGLQVECSYLTRNQSWDAIGYPLSRGNVKSTIRGRVESGALQGATWDVLLRIEGDSGISLEGLSGAPILVDGVARAVVIEQREPGLAAVSLHRIRSELEAVGASPVSQDTPADIPKRLREAIEASVPNLHAHALLDEAIDSGGYILLSGEPGGGKSVVAGQFEPQLPNQKVVGRYFAGPEQPLPYRHRMSPRAFLDWLVAITSRHSAYANGGPDNASIEKIAELILENLSILAGCSNGGKYVLIVDGFDEMAASQLPLTFLHLMPNQPPSGLAVVLTVNSALGIRQAFPEMSITSEVDTPPLSHATCEAVVQKRTTTTTPGEVVTLAHASGGNPLILNYVIEAYLQCGDADIAVRDAQHGLDGYYSRLWSRVSTDTAAIWTLAVLSHARGGLSPTQLGEIVPEAVSAQVPKVLVDFAHLIKKDEEGLLELYHLSLQRFLSKAAAAMEGRVLQSLGYYCLRRHNPYSIKNRVHHLLDTEGEQHKALEHCSQDWLDSTVQIGVEPEFPLSDIDRCLNCALHQGDFHTSVRLLLLRSRAAFRYDFLFSRYALEVGRIALRLNGAATAIGYVLRDEALLLSPEDAAAFVRDAIRVGSHEVAEHVYEAVRRRLLVELSSHGVPNRVLPAWVDLLCQSYRWTPHRSHRDLYFLFDILEAQHNEESNALVESLKSMQWADLLAETAQLVIPKRILEDKVRFAVHAATSFFLARQQNWGLPHSDLKTDFSGLPDAFEVVPLEDLASRVEQSLTGEVIPLGRERLFADFFLEVGRGRCLGFWKQLVPPRPFSLRMSNGVDVNWEDLKYGLFWIQKCSFCGENTGSNPIATRHPWEEHILDIFRQISRLSGEWAHEKPPAEYTWSEIVKLIRSCTFTLQERVAWEDSYAIPEELIPNMLQRLVRLTIRFAYDRCLDLVHALIGSGEGQLGVYTEGYVSSLLLLGKELRGSLCNEAARLVYQAIWDHVRVCVFARDSRVSALLECSLAFFDLGERDLGADVFREVVQSANGPDWYKEAQYTLLVDSLEAVGDPAFTGEHWPRVVRALEMASGEATFQRWVRSEKERLIGHLAAMGLVADAVSLLRHYNQPSLQEQLARIEREPVDRVSKGIGNRFGVSEVQEQVVVYGLAREFTEAPPTHRWCLVELLAPCGTDRETERLLRLGSNLIANDSSGELAKRAARFMYSDFDEERRDTLAVELGSETWPVGSLVSLVPAWQSTYVTTADEDGVHASPAASASSPSSSGEETDGQRPDELDEIILPGLTGPSAANTTLRECRRRDAPSTEVVRGLIEAKSGGWDIWESDHNFQWALNRLFEGGHKNGIRQLAILLMNDSRSTLDWRTAKQLIRYSAPTAGTEIRKAVFDLIVEHVEYLIRPEVSHLPAAVVPKASHPCSQKEAIERLLVSYLDHPSDLMRQRSADLLLWLALRSASLLDELARRVQEECIGYGRELAAAVLAAAVARGAAIQEADIARSVLFEWEDDDLFVHAALKGIGSARPSGGAVVVISAPSGHVSLNLDQLPAKQQGISAQQLAALHHEVLAASTGVETALVSDLWHMRSVVEYRPLGRVGTPWERATAGRAIADEAAQALLDRHALWNPEWTDHCLDGSWQPQIERMLKQLSSKSFLAAFTVGSELILHSHEIQRDARGRHRSLEIAAIHVEGRRLMHRFNASAAVPVGSLFDAADRPRSQVPGIANTVSRLPLVQHAVGGLGPARVSHWLTNACDGSVEGRRFYWRAGRVAEPHFVGEAAHEGIVTTASVRAIRKANLRLCWIVWTGKTPVLVDPYARVVMEIAP